MDRKELRKFIRDILSEDSGFFPAGAERNPRAPWSEKTPETKTPKRIFSCIYIYPKEFSILKKSSDGSLWTFYFADIITGEADKNAIENYVNDNVENLDYGSGLDAWEEGKNFVRIDDALRTNLLSMYGKSEKLLGALSGKV